MEKDDCGTFCLTLSAYFYSWPLHPEQLEDIRLSAWEKRRVMKHARPSFTDQSHPRNLYLVGCVSHQMSSRRRKQRLAPNFHSSATGSQMRCMSTAPACKRVADKQN